MTSSNKDMEKILCKIDDVLGKSGSFCKEAALVMLRMMALSMVHIANKIEKDWGSAIELCVYAICQCEEETPQEQTSKKKPSKRSKGRS